MMSNRNRFGVVLAALVSVAGAWLSGCAGEGTLSSGNNVLAGHRCSAASECGGLECETEHGVGVCRPHGSADAGIGAAIEGAACEASADCSAGMECEAEHGIGTCRAHSSVEDSARTTTSTVDGASCGSSADCAVGLECELEHGAGVCRAHGGGGGGAGGGGSDDTSDGGASSSADSAVSASGCATSADCAAGLECEVELGVGVCREHRSGGR